MRILMITFDPPRNVGGIEGRAVGYTKELLSKGFPVRVASFSPTSEFTEEPFFGTVMYGFPSETSQLPSVLKRMLRIMRQSSTDSVFLLSGSMTGLGIAILAYCRTTKKRSVSLYYGKDILQARQNIRGRLLLLGSNLLSKRIVTNSRFTASLLPLLALRKSTVLYPGVDPALGESGNATSRDNKRILFVGRLVRRKGVDDLIAAFRLVKEAIPDVSLEVVGDGPEMSRLQHLASELGLAGSVAFLGTLRGMALYERFRECDVFAMPSRTLEDDVEGFGTVFLEAGLFGRPSVGTYSGGIPEAVLDGVTGILVKEGDASALANALKTLLVNRELSRELGDNARKRVLQDFTWHEGTNTLVKILDSRR